MRLPSCSAVSLGTVVSSQDWVTRLGRAISGRGWAVAAALLAVARAVRLSPLAGNHCPGCIQRGRSDSMLPV